LEGIRTFF